MSKENAATALVDDVIRAAAHLEPELEEALAEHGLTRPSYLVLTTLLDAPDHRLGQRDLMAGVQRTSGTLSVRLARLERAGYVARERDPDDRRGAVVTLTDRGRERAEAARPAYADTARRLAAGLPDDERAAFAQRLRRAVGLPDRQGVLVLRVKRGSPADTAGLQRGDLVVRAAAADVHTIGDLHRAVSRANATLALDVVRGADERTLEVPLAAKDAA